MLRNPRPQPLRDVIGRVHDVRHVRLPHLVQRRRHADDHAVRLGEGFKIGRGEESLALDALRYPVGRDMADVALARVEGLDLFVVNVKANDIEGNLCGWQDR
jgi:hypothetical protein